MVPWIYNKIYLFFPPEYAVNSQLLRILYNKKLIFSIELTFSCWIPCATFSHVEPWTQPWSQRLRISRSQEGGKALSSAILQIQHNVFCKSLDSWVQSPDCPLTSCTSWGKYFTFLLNRKDDNKYIDNIHRDVMPAACKSFSNVSYWSATCFFHLYQQLYVSPNDKHLISDLLL